MTTNQMRDPKTDYLLTPENSALVLIDYQPMLVDGVKSQSNTNSVYKLRESAVGSCSKACLIQSQTSRFKRGLSAFSCRSM